MKNLIGSLESRKSSFEMNLATRLALCSMESIMLGQDGAWYTHLAGASGIIQSLQAVPEDGPDGILSKFSD
ncbi:hypothetical protein AWENTII_010742 [Aspergillus wentii]